MSFTRFVRPTVVFASGLLLMLGLTACAELLEGPTPETPARTEPPVPDEAPSLFPDGDAYENLSYFQQVIREYAASEQPVAGQPIVDAVVAAGFEKSQMQVSYDTSRMNLPADSIFVAVRLGETCLLGQVITENREWAAYADDAVGPENNICLIGDTRAIDW